MGTFVGTSGDDTLVGSDENDVLNGQSGNDTMSGGAGNDVFFSGGGDDTAFGGDGDDTLRGDGGNDVLDGGAGNDQLFGGSLNDVLRGGAGTNTINGDSGSDVIVKVIADGATDMVNGGTGLDTLDLDFGTDGVSALQRADLQQLNDWMQTVLANAGGDVNALAATDEGPTLVLPSLGLTLSNVETVNVIVDGESVELGAFLGDTDGGSTGGGGTPPPDGFDLLIEGTPDDDDLTGSAGRDYVLAGDGRDFVEAGDGADEVYGGAGDDRLFGGRDDDVLYGEDGNDILVGDHGNDQIFGGAGNDIAFGGGNDDRMFGADGDDQLTGDGGNDYIDGGAGNNTLRGGTGDDVFVHAFGSVNDVDGGTGVDTVVVQLSSGDLSDAVRADLASLLDFIDGNLDASAGDVSALASQEAGPQLTLAALGLTVTVVEDVEIVVDGAPVDPRQFLNVAPVVDAEVSVTTDEDTAFNGMVDATDTNGDVLSFAVTGAAAHGTVSLDAETGAYSYVPAADYSGADSFTITVTDNFGATATQTVSIVVDGVADAATLAVDDAVLTLEPVEIQGTRASDFLRGDQGLASGRAALDIQAALADTDGSETLEVRVTGLDSDLTLSAGSVQADGSVLLQVSELDGLEVIGAVAGDFELTVTAITRDGDDVAETSVAVTVTVDGSASLDDTISGGRGHDVLLGGLGNDTLNGDAGHDRLWGQDGDDVLSGGRGNDLLVGGDGSDVLDGGNGRDWLYGQDGDDALSGGRGNDLLAGGDGADTLDGGNGQDRLYGEDGDDTLEGGRGRDLLSGGSGDDVLDGGRGADSLYGGFGDDTLVGGFGRDYLNGGSGFDVADYSTAVRGVRVDLDAGTARGQGRDTLVSIEGVIGSDFNDRLTGDAGANTLDGGAGNDVLRGGSGADVLTGGAGADVFHWERSDMSLSSYDTITDFTVGEDQLDLTDLTYVGWNPPADEDRVWTQEVNGGTLVSMDMSYLPGATNLVFLEGVTGLSNDDDWFVI